MRSEHDLDRQLRSVLREVLDHEWGPDPVWAESPAARRISEGEGLRRRLRWPLRTLGVAALLVVGGGALILGGALDRPRPPDPSVDLQGWLDALAPGPGIGAVALVESGGDEWRGVSGTAGDGRPPAPDDSFPIIGTTETFTATVVLQLVGEGRVALDNNVERWLPGQVENGERVTIRQLLNHTSGLGGPQGQHHYSHDNYFFLARLVEVLTGEPLDVVLRDRIFLPLQLEHTTMTTLLTQPQIDATNWLGAPADVTSPPVSGAGGIVSTTADLATFFGALLGGDLLGERELCRDADHGRRDDGCGFGARSRDDGPRGIGHLQLRTALRRGLGPRGLPPAVLELGARLGGWVEDRRRGPEQDGV